MDSQDANLHTYRQRLARAEEALRANRPGDAIVALGKAAVFAWEHHCGVFLDPDAETLLAQIADHVNALHPMPSTPKTHGNSAPVGMLMSSIHHYGGHSRIAWRWMQLDRERRFQLVLARQGKYVLPAQVGELLESGRVELHRMSENDPVKAVVAARDELASAACVVLALHPDDAVGATVAACLRAHTPIVFIDHAFFSYSLGMTCANAVCCTGPDAVDIATGHRLVSPEHLVWYRNAPEWAAAPPEGDPGLRARYGIGADEILLLSSGSEFKFSPLGGKTLFELVAPVLRDHPAARLMVVGVPPSSAQRLGEVYTQIADRVILVAPVEERLFLDFLQAADIYLEAAPVHSGGASQLAMLLGKPTLNYTDPLVYRGHLGPRFYSVEDFAWFRFSVEAYRADLGALVTSADERQARGRWLQDQVAARINEAANVASIETAYARATLAPKVAHTLGDPAHRVHNPSLVVAQQALTAAFRTYRQQGPAVRRATPGAVRAIAFHRPQFHAIPENDTWWGKGFTDWTDVRQGEPLFEGHYQPHVPAGDDYYDLGDVQVLSRQAALARAHGIEGFCFYHYWFEGRRLLEKPVDQLLAHPEIDLPYCLCWTNENWTRRWDGGEHGVLMRQNHAPELDERFALDLLPYLRDQRYIKVNGRPLVLVLRLDNLPDPARTMATWRGVWLREGIGEVYLVGIEHTHTQPPATTGVDAACEFPPSQVDFDAIAPESTINRIRAPDMMMGDYATLAKQWLARPRPPYPRHRCLVPSWDNTARRRRGGATLLIGATPERYEDWLRQTVAWTLTEWAGEERLVFINAWNDWGAGCHLEPDKHHGADYLEATRRVLGEPAIALRAALPDPDAAREEARSALEMWAKGRQSPPPTKALLADLAVAVVGRSEALSETLASLRAAGLSPTTLAGFDSEDPASLVRWAETAGAPWLLVLPAGSRVLGEGLAQLRSELLNADSCRAACLDMLLLAADGSCEPLLRPDPNLDLLLSDPAHHALGWVLSRAALADIGGLSAGAGEATVLDALLRLIEAAGLQGLGHLATPVLSVPAPTSLPTGSQDAVLAHLRRRGYDGARLWAGATGKLRIHYGHGAKPLVSIIIPARNQLPALRRCVETLMEKTAYHQYELLIVDNGSTEQDARAWLDGLTAMGLDQVRVLPYPRPFNDSAIKNFGARSAQGEYLLLLDHNTAVLQNDWLDAMLNHAQRPEVGVVGARLLFPDGRLEHAGYVLGLNGPAGLPYFGLSSDHSSTIERLQVDHDVSAVSGACLMVRRSLYEALGGLDEVNFAATCNDIDLCLRVVQSGHLVVWTPHAVIMRTGNASPRVLHSEKQKAEHPASEGELDALYARWLPHIAHDPAYNPNLTLHGRGYEPDHLPRRRHSDRPLILAHPADADGSGSYRISKPFEALLRAERIQGGVTTEWPAVPALARVLPDVHLLQRPLRDVQLAEIERYRRHVQAFTVYELDANLPELRLGDPGHADMPADVRRAIERGLAMADRLVVATPALADAFRGWHADIRVMESRLPVDGWGALPRTRREGGRPRVGWAGDLSHNSDLAMITDVVRTLADEVDWVFFGVCPSQLRPYLAEYHRSVGINRYPAYLAGLNLDLAIAPLEDTAFNRCRSPMQLLEYGACGLPVVCSDVHAFAEYKLPVTRIPNRTRDWVEAIRCHLADPEGSAAEGMRLKAEVHRSWMLEGETLDGWFSAWTPG